jgi:hypothetical protein
VAGENNWIFSTARKMLPNISLFLVARYGLAKITRIFWRPKKEAAENSLLFFPVHPWQPKIRLCSAVFLVGRQK